MMENGKFRGETYAMKKGYGCSIWYPIGRNKDIGPCFDFLPEDIDDLMGLLEKMKKAKAKEKK